MMTVQAAYDLFLGDRRSYCAPKTLETYHCGILLFFRWLEGRFGQPVYCLPLCQEENIYSGYKLHLREIGIRSVTIRSYCRSIAAFLRWCYENDLCGDYLKGVKLPKSDARPKLPLYRDEMEKIDALFDMDTIQGIRNYCIVHFMADCGLRTQEVLHLQHGNLMPERNLLQVLDSKGNKNRLVLVPDFLLAAVSRYCSMAGIHGGFLFRSLKGNVPMTGNTVRQLFGSLKKLSGIERLHAHLLRHTFATSYLMGGGNLEFLRVFMGHTDYAVTQTYSRMAAEYKMLGADIYRLDDIFFTRGY